RRRGPQARERAPAGPARRIDPSVGARARGPRPRHDATGRARLRSARTAEVARGRAVATLRAMALFDTAIQEWQEGTRRLEAAPRIPALTRRVVGRVLRADARERDDAAHRAEAEPEVEVLGPVAVVGGDPGEVGAVGEIDRERDHRAGDAAAADVLERGPDRQS